MSALSLHAWERVHREFQGWNPDFQLLVTVESSGSGYLASTWTLSPTGRSPNTLHLGFDDVVCQFWAVRENQIAF